MIAGVTDIAAELQEDIKAPKAAQPDVATAAR